MSGQVAAGAAPPSIKFTESTNPLAAYTLSSSNRSLRFMDASRTAELSFTANTTGLNETSLHLAGGSGKSVMFKFIEGRGTNQTQFTMENDGAKHRFVLSDSHMERLTVDEHRVRIPNNLGEAGVGSLQASVGPPRPQPSEPLPCLMLEPRLS